MGGDKRHWERRCLNEIGNIGGHLLDLSVVESLDFVKQGEVLVGNEVNGHTLTTETTRTTNPMDVALQVLGDVVVDDQGNLLDVNTTRQQISGDENTRRTAPKFFQDNITMMLRDVSVGRGDDELTALHLLGQPVDLPPGVAKDDSLGNVDGVVQIAQSLQLVLVNSNVDIELLDTLEGQLSPLNQNLNGVVHEAFGDFESLLRHGSREETDVNVTRESGEDGVDLVTETTGQHVIGLVKDENLDGVRAKNIPAQHIVHTTGGTNDDMDSFLEFLNIVAHPGPTNARVAVRLHVSTQRMNNLLNLLSQLASGGKDKSLALENGGINLLEDTNGEGSSLSGSGLGLRDGVEPLDERKDSPLLNSGRTLETHSVDTPEEVGFQVHVIEIVDDFFFVRTRSIASRFNDNFITIGVIMSGFTRKRKERKRKEKRKERKEEKSRVRNTREEKKKRKQK